MGDEGGGREGGEGGEVGEIVTAVGGEEWDEEGATEGAREETEGFADSVEEL